MEIKSKVIKIEKGGLYHLPRGVAYILDKEPGEHIKYLHLTGNGSFEVLVEGWESFEKQIKEALLFTFCGD
jgi:hypothetical protein